MKKPNNIFFETFVGEFVEIVQDFEITQSISISEDGPQELRVPMTVAGFVMDCDDRFVYLGPDGESVNQALPISTIKHIGIVDMKEPAPDAFEDLPDPEDKKNYN
jgi:hypothetical protein